MERSIEGDEIGEVWTVTRGTEELERERAEENARRELIEKGLRRCPVCKGAAKIVEFGLEGNGVWVGCDRTAECSRNIVLHIEGWSIEEAAAEWNRYNSGIYLLLRKMKMWVERHLGARKRLENQQKREEEKRQRALDEKRREVFGIKNKPKVWQKVLGWVKGRRETGKKEGR